MMDSSIRFRIRAVFFSAVGSHLNVMMKYWDSLRTGGLAQVETFR